MRDLEDELADIDLRIQLFANLAGQRRLMRFPLVNLPAGKLPETGEVDACLAPRDEKRAAFLDDRSHDHDHALEIFGKDVHERVIGHASHLGFRAVQIVAPKSISA